MIDFNQKSICLTKECTEQHERMKAKGFYDSEVFECKKWALIVSEFCEAMEAERKGKVIENDVYDIALNELSEIGFELYFKKWVKDTVSDELADVFIRCMDAVGKYNKDNNDIVLFKHCIDGRVKMLKDSPKTFAYYVYILSEWATLNGKTCCQSLMVMMELCAAIAIIHNIDLGKAIEAKIRYNELRGQKHEKKY